MRRLLNSVLFLFATFLAGGAPVLALEHSAALAPKNESVNAPTAGRGATTVAAGRGLIQGVHAIVSVTPNTGAMIGGTAVTILGSGFLPGATVTFGGTAASSVVVVDSTTITAVTPSSSVTGSVHVIVTNPGGEAFDLAAAFTYTPFRIELVTPNSGAIIGGTSVTISGHGFAADATVRFGANAATSVVVVNSTTITAGTPAGASVGVVDVVVTNPGVGSVTKVNGFTYTPFTIGTVTPSSGSLAGGTAITISGAGFAADATVKLGAHAASSVVVVDPATITAVTPAGAGAGAVDVVVTNPGVGSVTLAGGFTYSAGVEFFTVAPCRVINTRTDSAPEMSPGERRNFLVAGSCGVSAVARSVAVNVTVAEPAAAGFLKLFAGDAVTEPGTSTLNFRAGQVKANNAIVPLGLDGKLAISNGSAGTLNVLVDVLGYFQ